MNSWHNFDTVTVDDKGSVRCKKCGYTTHYTNAYGGQCDGKAKEQIYIKTEMTKMPKGCFECKRVKRSKVDNTAVFCAANVGTTVSIAIKDINVRPEWCPLVEK